MLIGLGLLPGTPIELKDFPSSRELLELVDPFGDQIHPRARISSKVVIGGDRQELMARGFDVSFVDGLSVVITYYDDYVVWDYDSGLREVRVPDGDYFYLTDDGSWLESHSFEWPPFGPLQEWMFAQVVAEDFLEVDPSVVGYEHIAGVPTVRLQLGEGFAHLWLDELGAVMRLVFADTASSVEFPMFMIWDVETLDPELTGPLPTVP